MSTADDPFTLFCLYYLGLTSEGEVRFFNANQLARRFNTTVPDLMEALARHGLHPDAVLNTDFPLPKFQVALQEASVQEGPTELLKRAQLIYRQYREHEGKRRDWLREIEREREEDLHRRGE